jgi:hypothetical protein
MSLLDQNWGAGGNAEDETQDENQQGRPVNLIDLFNKEKRSLSLGFNIS